MSAKPRAPSIPPYARYDELSRILRTAFAQAAIGKGERRHGGGLPWERQHTALITRELGIGFPLGQAMKKILEAPRLPTTARQVAELLGAINYIASAVYQLERQAKRRGSAR